MSRRPGRPAAPGFLVNGYVQAWPACDKVTRSPGRLNSPSPTGTRGSDQKDPPRRVRVLPTVTGPTRRRGTEGRRRSPEIAGTKQFLALLCPLHPGPVKRRATPGMVKRSDGHCMNSQLALAGRAAPASREKGRSYAISNPLPKIVARVGISGPLGQRPAL
jgi:hypothetical protein